MMTEYKANGLKLPGQRKNKSMRKKEEIKVMESRERKKERLRERKRSIMLQI